MNMVQLNMTLKYCPCSNRVANVGEIKFALHRQRNGLSMLQSHRSRDETKRSTSQCNCQSSNDSSEMSQPANLESPSKSDLNRSVGNESSRSHESKRLSPLERAMAYKASKLKGKGNPAISLKNNVECEPPEKLPEVEMQRGTIFVSQRFQEVIEVESAAQTEVEVVASNLVLRDDEQQTNIDLGSTQALEELDESQFPTSLDETRTRNPTNLFGGNNSEQGFADKPRKRDVIIVEIITRDGIIKKEVIRPTDSYSSFGPSNLREEIDAKDFIGLEFGDKKDKRSLPAGLSAGFDMPTGPLPEVEIITRKASENSSVESEDENDLYKPKVSSWGVFPRAKNISSEFGGGRTIRPGEALEAEEEREAREKKTRLLLEDYRRMAGLTMDPQVKAVCEKAMENGESLMNGGKLQEAVQQYDSVISQTVFKSTIHGNAMYQKAVCLDSLARFNDAKLLYEKLGNHPDMGVRKRARTMSFGFQAEKALKVRSDSTLDRLMYQKYFDALADADKYAYWQEEGQEADNNLSQLVPFIAFLLSPIVLVFVLAIQKGS